MTISKTSSYRKTIFIAGFSAVITQICLIRELLVLFHGNELSIGIIFFNWLIFTALGAALTAAGTQKAGPAALAAVQILFGFSIPAAAVLAKSGPAILGLVPGETAGFGSLFIISAAALAPVCSLSGSLYTLTCLAESRRHSETTVVSRIYLAEAAGSGLGGLVFSIWLISILPVNAVLTGLFFLNLAGAAVFHLPGQPRRTVMLFCLILLPLCLLVMCRLYPLLNMFEAAQRAPAEHLVTEDTPYGRIEIIRLEDQYTFFQDGVAIFTVPDQLEAEASVHISLLQHPAPRRILLLGGILPGSIRETLKHPGIERIDYVEQDPRLVSLARTWLPEKETAVLDDRRVRLHFSDCRRFVRQTQNNYDVIISNLPPPFTARLNRFYTQEFFAEIKNLLKNGGVFSLKIPASENALSDEEAGLIRIISATAASVFEHTILIPGEPVRLFASSSARNLTAQSAPLISRLKERNLSLSYIREYYLPFQMSAERTAGLHKRIESAERQVLNRDFKPAAYYFSTLVYAAYFQNSFNSLLTAVGSSAPAGLPLIIGILLIVLSAYILCTARKKHSPGIRTGAVSVSVFLVGFSEISLELMLITGFQVLYGSAYQQLAVIIAGYMLGLTLGSRSISLSAPALTAAQCRQKFLRFQLLMGLCPLLVLVVFFAAARLDLRAGPLTETLVFSILAGAAGYIGGVQFPLANIIFLRQGLTLRATAGRLYAVDLTGSAGGALLTGAVLIPLLGMPMVLLSLAGANLYAHLMLKTVFPKKTPGP